MDNLFKNPSRPVLFLVHSTPRTGDSAESDLAAGGNKQVGFLEEGLHFVMDTCLPLIFIVLLESKTWVRFSVNCFS